jgi:predicted Zn-dependent protease
MKLLRHLTLSLPLLVLVACAAPVSQTPVISAAELQQEQAEQEKVLREEKNRSTTAAETQSREDKIERLKRVGTKVAQSADALCKQTGISSCVYPFALDKEDAPVNAYTDGKKIVVAPKMMEFAYDDLQLATVLAHEYAHALMTHPQKTTQNATIGGLLGMAVDGLAQSQGIGTGGAFQSLGQQGAVLRYSQGFEKEADYIGMYILAGAGYDYTQAAKFWRRMATLNPKGIYTGSTHPTTAERYLLLDKTAAEITQKKQSGAPLIPQRLPEE